MFHLKQDSESGMVLLVAVVVTFLGTILAGSFMSITIYEAKHSVWQKHRSQSLFLAEAGVEQALYHLNNDDSPGNYYTGSLANGRYEVTLYSPAEKPWLPLNSYLVDSTGFLERINSRDIEYRVLCIVRKLPNIPIPAALAVLDDADAEAELIQFDSVEWTISGRDMDTPGGLPGIAFANLAISAAGLVDENGELLGDDLLAQLGERVTQVTGREKGIDPLTNETVFVDTAGNDALMEDPSLPQDLNAYADYFEKIAIRVSGMGNIPKELLGTYAEPTVLYANLSEGPLRLLPQQPGYGVLVLDGIGDFKLDDVSMEGNAEWFGLIICARDSEINLTGGGKTASHIYGALLVANGKVIMNGTADIVYSSDSIMNIEGLLLYQVYSWCGGWGEELGSDSYSPVANL